MIHEITNNEELKTLRREMGYILNIDIPTRRAIFHRTSCEYCFSSKKGMNPSSKKYNKTGIFYFTKEKKEIIEKTNDYRLQGYVLKPCIRCLPRDFVHF